MSIAKISEAAVVEQSESQSVQLPEWMGTPEQVTERMNVLKKQKVADLVGAIFFGALAIGVSDGSLVAIPEFFHGMKSLEIGLLSLTSGLNILTAIHKNGLVNMMRGYLETTPQSLQ